jgi:indolepyruvate ferredoxin oxidoreductase beta subunit
MDRVDAVCAAEQAWAGDFPVTRETARYLALWMSYEDVIRVADLKTRGDRLQRVRDEVGARQGEPLRLTEYLKPGLDEVCSLLPTRAADWLRKRLAHKAHKLSVGLHMRTDTVRGFAMLCVLRSLRPLRRRTSRYAFEQAMIERWLDAVRRALALSPRLAFELALCGNLVKGYGETSERGHRNLGAVLDDMHGLLHGATATPPPTTPPRSMRPPRACARPARQRWPTPRAARWHVRSACRRRRCAATRYTSCGENPHAEEQQDSPAQNQEPRTENREPRTIRRQQ